MFKPINELNSSVEIIDDGVHHYIVCGEKKFRVYAHPAMWNARYREIPTGAVPISDKLLKDALPKVDAIIRDVCL